MRTKAAMLVLTLIAAVSLGGCGLAGVASTAAGAYGIYAATSQTETEIEYPPTPTVLLGTVSQAGIEGGRITAIAGTNAGEAWVGTHRAGIFKKTAPGGPWTAMNSGFNRNLSVTAFAIDENDADRVLAATGDYYGGGVYATADGGATWTEASTGLTNLDVRCLAAVPGTNPQRFLAGTGSGIFYTIDNGASWTAVGSASLNSLNISALAVDPDDTDDYYAATRGGGLFFTENGGTLWEQKVSGLTDPNLTCMAIHFVTGAGTNTLYIGTATQGVWVASDDGTSWSAWSQTGTGLQLPDLKVLCLAVDPNSANNVYAGCAGGLRFYIPGGADTWENPAGTDPTDSRIISLHVDPTDSDVLFAGGYSHGLFRSTTATGAENFSALNSGLIATEIETLALSPSDATTLYAAGGYEIAGGTSFGAAYSINSGTAWSFPTTAPNGDNFRGLACHPTAAMELYAALDGDGVWRSVNDGQTWTKVWAGTGTEDVLAVSAFDLGGTVTLFAGTDGYGAWYSTNSGGTWTQCAGIPNTAQVRDFTQIALSSTEVWAVSNAVVYASTDSGATFTAFASSFTGTTLTCLQADPATALTVYVGTSSQGVYCTKDGGLSFAKFNQFVEGSSNIEVRDLSAAAAGAAASYVYMAASTGIYRLTAGSDGWNPVHNGDLSILLPDKRRIIVANCIAARGSDPGMIWIGTAGRGVMSVQIVP